jgi:hypothetical protein
VNVLPPVGSIERAGKIYVFGRFTHLCFAQSTESGTSADPVVSSSCASRRKKVSVFRTRNLRHGLIGRLTIISRPSVRGSIPYTGEG